MHAATAHAHIDTAPIFNGAVYQNDLKDDIITERSYIQGD